ncbi:M15 family metallopeptidase [Thalassotalea fusca]
MHADCLTGKSDHHIDWLGENLGLHQAVVEHWQALCSAAQSDGIDLAIVSGFRNFDRQLAIWNAKYQGLRAVKDLNNDIVDLSKESALNRIKAIMLYSALPGTSRHHWGTDIDIYSPSMLPADQTLQLEPWEYGVNGPFNKLTTWLRKHANQFGFYFPYQKYLGGVAPEPWHLSYYPLANEFMSLLTEKVIHQAIIESDIIGKEEILSALPTLYNQYITNISTSINHNE